MGNKLIPHGVYIRIGPLPMKMCWDLEMARWFSWPTGISYEDHLEAQHKSIAEEAEELIKEAESFDINKELHRIPQFMLIRRKTDGVF